MIEKIYISGLKFGSVTLRSWPNPTLSEVQRLLCKNGANQLHSAGLLKDQMSEPQK